MNSEETVICKCGRIHNVKRGDCFQCPCGEWIWYEDEQEIIWEEVP